MRIPKSESKACIRPHGLPKLVCITGVDGVGKTTLAKWLVSKLTCDGYKSKLVWSRFNNLTSKPFLGITRLTGHNYYIAVKGSRLGFHDFEKLYGFRHLFAVMQCCDVNIAAYRDISRQKNLYDVLVCERGPWDTMVDVISDTGLEMLTHSPLGKLYTAQVKNNSQVFLVQRSKENIQKCRAELIGDKKLETRMRIYEHLARQHGWIIVDNNGPIEIAKNLITARLRVRPESS